MRIASFPCRAIHTSGVSRRAMLSPLAAAAIGHRGSKASIQALRPSASTFMPLLLRRGSLCDPRRLALPMGAGSQAVRFATAEKYALVRRTIKKLVEEIDPKAFWQITPRR